MVEDHRELLAGILARHPGEAAAPLAVEGDVDDRRVGLRLVRLAGVDQLAALDDRRALHRDHRNAHRVAGIGHDLVADRGVALDRSEEHTSELQSLMRISYAVFCLKKKK